MKRVALVAVLFGCHSWPDFSPADPGGTVDPRLGTEVARTAGSFRGVAVMQRDGVLVLAEDSLSGWFAKRFDPGSLTVEDVAAPPLQPGELVGLGHADAPGEAIYVTTENSEVHVSLLAGDAWTALPAPALRIGSGDAAIPFVQALAHDGRAYVTMGTHTLVYDGAAWSEPIPATADVQILGGFDATTQWVVTRRGGALTAIPISATSVAGAAITGPVVTADPLISAVNGTADAFQVAAGHTLYAFDGSAFTPGSTVATSPVTAPGSPRVLIASDVAGDPPYAFAESGVLAGSATVAFTAQLDGTPVGSVFWLPSPAADQLAMVLGTAVDGYAVATVRVLDLPVTSDPFAP